MEPPTALRWRPAGLRPRPTLAAARRAPFGPHGTPPSLRPRSARPSPRPSPGPPTAGRAQTVGTTRVRLGSPAALRLPGNTPHAAHPAEKLGEVQAPWLIQAPPAHRKYAKVAAMVGGQMRRPPSLRALLPASASLWRGPSPAKRYSSLQRPAGRAGPTPPYGQRGPTASGLGRFRSSSAGPPVTCRGTLWAAGLLHLPPPAGAVAAPAAPPRPRADSRGLR